MTKITRPVTVAMPSHGVVFAESIHGTDFRMPLRADPFHKLIYVLQGSVIFRNHHANRETTAGPGTLLAVENGTAHQLRDQSPATLLLLCCAPRFIKSDPSRRTLWRVLGDRAQWHVPAGKLASQRFENLWRQALLEQTTNRADNTVAVHALAAQILVALARLPATTPHRDSTARRIDAVVHDLTETFYDEWTLDGAAARAGLSRRRFSDLFRAQAGTSFLERLTTLRLDHAAALLRQGNHSVTGVAFSCGYRDLSHFYRAFRRRYGRPPGEWRLISG